ncbi:MAG: heavy metal sensor histidine kinase [Hydrogenophaga sp.]|jgi:two-component system heavy metal sensor histidine kinase CusS|uniref:heavy metal sensor histidine kinase n=1 Tax=Hydrogenophaga sp. TaxID=1904254 RepID=UPI00272F8B0E|nr:heavy metal sensor histidine kinase [Hydrogenophaga sp.]MDP2406309.1 heavy metal sensor histidine kinase [Hydrogenophaga sp.]MDZ4176366.1 heavy metal sensor histidine kinase [Hydrogenophaga sp.]
MLGRLSLTARLTAFYALVSATVLVGLAILVAFATSRHFVELDRGYLQDKIGLVQKIVGESPSPDLLSSRLDELLDSHHGLFIDLRQGDRVVYGSQGMVFPSGLAPNGATPTDWTLDDQTLRGLSARIDLPPTPSNEPGAGGAPMQLLIALDTGHHLHFMRALSQTLVLYSLGAILVSGLLGWWAARRGLAPLRIMKERAMTVTAQKLDQRMPVEAVPVEFADLAESLNTMLGRLQADFARLQEFSSDLAHELRTPINNLLTQTQVSLAQKRDAEAYRDILASNAEEFQRLARMVSDMLFLAKTEHGLELPNAEAISLDQEALDLFDFYDAVADEKRIRLKIMGQAHVMGDRLMVRRAIGNLLSNALRHSPAEAEVMVALEERPGEATLCITNSGMTIAPEVLPRLFDRFFRVDKSRSHPESDGTGLGLSITQAIMRAHGGSVSVTSAQGKTTFCLTFRSSLAV